MNQGVETDTRPFYQIIHSLLPNDRKWFFTQRIYLSFRTKLFQIIYTYVVKFPFSSDIFMQTTFLGMHFKSNQYNDAHNMFERIPIRDVASWKSMLVGFA